MLDDPIFQSNAGDNYKGLGNPLDDHGPGQPSGNFPSEPPPGTPGVQVWRSFPFPFTRTHKRRGKDSRPPLRRDGLWDDIDWKDSRPHAQVDGITKDWRMHYCYEAPPGPPDEEGEPQEPPQERPPDPQRL